MIRQFNELKQYFRHYETRVSKNRIQEFRRFAKDLEEKGIFAAFDFMGSINFGQAMPTSDVDMVIYVCCADDIENECIFENCHIKHHIEELLKNRMKEKNSSIPFEIQVLDCINLHELNNELIKNDLESTLLFRFAFYRSVCRLVNAKLIRPYQLRLEENQQLIERMQPDIHIILENLVHSSKHNLSFKKYQERIKESGVHIPSPILYRIREHLDQAFSVHEELNPDQDYSNDVK